MEQEVKHRMLVWIDCELTGLDERTDRLLEVAVIVTDSNLKVLAEGPNLIIHQPDEVLSQMDKWCQENHAKSGLIKAVRESRTSVQECEDQVLAFLRGIVPVKVCPLAGNSVYMDAIFLRKFLPRVMNHLHYRIVDVSTIKTLCQMWHPEIYAKVPKKRMLHRALDDIRESIEELQFYQQHLFANRPIEWMRQK